MSVVLVTGASGFVAAHVIDQLLNAGHDVRATLRTEARKQVVLDMLRQAGTRNVERLSFVLVDLLRDEGWLSACQGCDFVMHVASPMIATKDPNAVIAPAVNGVLRVLKAARDAHVKRVVFTSTCGAVYYGHPLRAEPFDETSWTDTEAGGMSLYVKSKALAERAAWDFMAREGGDLELTTVNPTGIFGPALGPDYSESLDLIRRLLDGSMPACPDLWFGVVDVRDVAELHLRAMTSPAAKGERFIASAGNAVSLREIAGELRARLAQRASKVPTRKLPTFVVRVLALFNQQLADLVPLLGKVRNASGAKAKLVLGWESRGWPDTVVATAESLLSLGVAAPGK